VTKGRNFPEDVIQHWPEVFGEISLNVIPIHYLDSITVTFKNGKIWELNINKNSNDKFELELKEWLSSYESDIENVDFKLDTERIKKDVIKNTNKFLKNRKLK